MRILGLTKSQRCAAGASHLHQNVYNFRFSADKDFKDKLERLAEVVGIQNAQKNMAEIIEKALDIALEKKDPKKKLERRRKKQQRDGCGAISFKRDEP